MACFLRKLDLISMIHYSLGSLKFVFRRLTGTWGFKFPRASFKFTIRHHRIKIGKTTVRLRRSKNRRFRGWWTFPFHKVTYYVRFTTRGIRVVSMKGKKIITGRVTTRPRRTHKPRPRPRPRPGKLTQSYVCHLCLNL